MWKTILKAAAKGGGKESRKKKVNQFIDFAGNTGTECCLGWWLSVQGRDAVKVKLVLSIKRCIQGDDDDMMIKQH